MNLESAIRKKSARDPRISGLREIGLSWKLVKVAEAIGYDAFMVFWAEVSVLYPGDQSALCIKMPPITSYHRAQRNQVIRMLLINGHNPGTVRKAMASLGVDVSERHICRQKAMISIPDD